MARPFRHRRSPSRSPVSLLAYGPADVPATGTRVRSTSPPACSGTAPLQARRPLLRFARAERRARELGRDAAAARGRHEPGCGGRDRGAHARTRRRLPSARRLDPACPPGRVRPPSARACHRSAGSLALAAAAPPALIVLGAILIGLAAGIPFAPVFQGAARRGRTHKRRRSASSTARRARSSSWGRRCSDSHSRSREGEGPASWSWPPLGCRPSAAPERRSAGSRRQTRARIAFRMMSAASAASAGSASSSG